MVQSTLRVDPALYRQMLATWYRFDDGLFYPVLVGWLGTETCGKELTYLVLQQGELVGFSTWQEARDVAAAAQRVEDAPLITIEQGQSSLHARRPARKARRSTPRAKRLRLTITPSGGIYELAGTAFKAVGPDGWPLDM